MPIYIAQLHKDPNSDFGVTFPDFPGCVTAANDLQTLQRNAAEALTLHIAGMVEDGDEVPLPTSLDDYTGNAENDPKLPILLVDVAVTAPRAIRVNVTLPEDVLAAIDRVSGNRSRFLADAARAKLKAA